MKFFIPETMSETLAEQIHATIREFLDRGVGAVVSPDRIFRLEYAHEGKYYRAEVGKPHPYDRGAVVAIFFEPLRKVYHICTPNRGMGHTMSLLVGAYEVHSREDFEPASSN
ncbi:MAG: hypothetical protein HY650_00380 [Acidobacteria bacterium]|nr:hypothetical protein [Acidobacteriota bacterium]